MRGAPRFSLLVFSLLLTADPGRAITFNDGLTHVIDAANSFPLEDVDVLNLGGGGS